MDAKDIFLNGFYGVFEKTAAEDENDEPKEEGEKKSFPFPMKKKKDEEKKDDKKDEKKDDKEDKEGEEKAASVFMDGFSDFFDKVAETSSDPLDAFLKRIGKA